MRAPWTLVDGILFLGAEWASPQIALQVSALRSLHLIATVGGAERDASLSVGFLFGNVHVSAEGWIPHAWREAVAAWAERRAAALNAQRVTRPEESGPIYAYQLDPFSPLGRQIGFTADESCWRNWSFYLWSNGDWSRGNARKAPWSGNGWTAHLDLERLIFGREVRRARVVEEGATTVFMPEGSYPATYTVEEIEVSRPRARSTRCWLGKIEIPNGIPFPGKGESGHDCGEDAAFGFGEVYDHRPRSYELADAIEASVTKSRERHGGKGWTPREQPCPST